MLRMRDTGAFSLIETLIAFFILISAFAVFFRLYHGALDSSQRTERRIRAANVAQRQMAKLRAWSAEKSAGAYGFDDWSTWVDTTFPDEEYPEYQVRIQTAFVPLTTPCTQLLTGATPLTMQRSTRKVQMTVSWDGGDLTLGTLICDPTRQLRDTDPVEVDADTPGPVARDGLVNLEARVFDSDGREIPDIISRWYVRPITGSGLMVGEGKGATAVFINASERFDGSLTYTGGTCAVVAEARYRGEEARGETPPLALLP